MNSQQGRLVHVIHVLDPSSLSVLVVLECSPCPGITINLTFWSYLGLGIPFNDQININLYLYLRVVWFKMYRIILSAKYQCGH